MDNIGRNMAKCVYGIEGLDSTGKSTLIKGILNREGFYQVIHFGKPEVLDDYAKAVPPAYEQGGDIALESYPKFLYQQESFRNSMIMAKSGARIIFDRWFIGEVPYSKLYRSYDGSYVFDIERHAELHLRDDIRLILLTEDFKTSRHFTSDGESFDDSRREEEQNLFIEAFHRSIIRDKRLICVTNPMTGQFRPREQILDEALAEG